MGRKRDEESGKYTDAYEDDDFIVAIEENDGVAGTSEIASTIGCSNRQALNRLKELEKENIVQSKDLGRSLVWQLVE